MTTALIVLSIAAAENKPVYELTYIFCSDEYLRQINMEHLDHDYYTDIITFDNAEDEHRLEGDIFISLDRIRDNANILGVTFEHEFHRVLAHGLLHLIGYGDKSPAEEQQMRAKEDFYLARYGH